MALLLWIQILLLSSLNSHAGVEEYGNKTLHLTFGVETPGYNLEFKGQNGSSIRFSPNLLAVYSVGASIQGLVGGSYGFRAQQTERDQQLKGQSHYDDWRLHYNFGNIFIAMNYSQFSSFYVQDSATADPSWTQGQPYFQEPDLYARTAGINFTWIVSPERYSLEAALDQTARQTESGGSWLLGLAASETVFKNSGPIIPAAVQGAYGSAQTLSEGRFLALTLKGGFGYTFVLSKKYFASTEAQLGFGEQRNTLSGAGFNRTKFTPATKAEALLSFGYNGDDYFGGLSFSGDGTIFNADSIQIISTLWSARLFWGLRL